MKKWLKALLIVSVLFATGLFCANDIYADENLLSGVSDAVKSQLEKHPYFKIYATAESVLQNPEAGCETGSTNSACTTGKMQAFTAYLMDNGNGAFSVVGKSNDDHPSTILDLNAGIRDNNLKVYVNKGGNCRLTTGGTIQIPTGDNIESFRNNVNAALGGTKWVVTCDIDYASTNVITYLFSVDDVTQPGLVAEDATGNIVPLEQATESTCMNSGGANTLGWIVCPLLDWMSDASQTLYDGFVKPALQVDPKLFAGGPNDGTREGWEIFRNIANVVFIILFLVVIFSQLTGVGIDNYGIKKILPKLIISAILINLSYWICLVFIDLSNIVGNSIQQLFEYMGAGLSMSSDAYSLDLTSSLGSTALTSVVVLGLVATGIWSIAQDIPGFLVALLVAAISAVVALFFLFLILAAREAAIVVLTVIAPLAFVCFILPNTKNLFDKWWKLGEALLLVYPIAGLLVGGGNFVSQLLLVAGAGSGSLFSAFVAMLVGIVPIFFIPTVLKNSFQGLGNIGAKVSGIGQKVGGRLSGAADKGIRGSERFKNYQNELGRRRQESTANRTINRLNRRAARNGGQLSTRDQRLMARSSETLDKLQREDRAASTVLAEREYENRTEAELRDDWSRAFDAGDTDKLDALTNVLISKYGTGSAKYIGDALAGKSMTNADGTVNQAAVRSMSTLRDNMQHNSSFGQMMRGKASDAYQMISSGGVVGRDNQGNLQYADLGHFSANNVISTNAGDWATQSASTLQRALENGALTTEQAQEILNSTDPAIQSGLQTDAKKRDVLQAAVQDPNINLSDENAVSAAAAQYRQARDAAANAPTIIGGGAYEHSNSGNVVHLNQMSDGTFVNPQNGQVVDITHYKKH